MELELISPERRVATGAGSLPPVPWRDPHTVSKHELQGYIEMLEQACAANPRNADLRTCLGMAHAVNLDVYRSMDALEKAVELEPANFWAQVKYAELHYRIRALSKAEREMLAALDLATSSFEAAVARRHLLEIRKLMREGTQKPEWTKQLRGPAVALVAMMVLAALMVMR